MGNRQYMLLAPRQCEGCGKQFQPQRRNQTYHNQACKQKAYYQRTKRNKNVLRNVLDLPVLSLFPGIGLLDRAFEECGFFVVRGPDLLWGDDIRDFHPQPGHFGGIIGGPPCQAFSRLRYVVEHNGYELAPNLIPEFERCVREAQRVSGSPLGGTAPHSHHGGTRHGVSAGVRDRSESSHCEGLQASPEQFFRWCLTQELRASNPVGLPVKSVADATAKRGARN